MPRSNAQADLPGQLRFDQTEGSTMTATPQPEFDFQRPDRLEQATRLAGCGLCVMAVPLRAKKRTEAWKHYQTERPTEEALKDWMRAPTNLAIVTGAISGIVVVDLDTPEAVAWAVANLPATPIRTATTQGEHWFYKHPGRPVKCRGNESLPYPLSLGSDVKGDGGYVMSPGSIHPSGAVYRAEGEWTPQTFESLPVYPEALLPYPETPAAPSPTKPTTQTKAQSNGRPAGLDRATTYAAKVPGVSEGGRNRHLFKVGGKLQIGFDLSESDALPLLRQVNDRCDPPLCESELLTCLRSSSVETPEYYRGYLLDKNRDDYRAGEQLPSINGRPLDQIRTTTGDDPEHQANDIPEEPEDLDEDFNDDGNARAFYAEHIDTLRFCNGQNGSGNWYHWVGNRWMKDEKRLHLHLWNLFAEKQRKLCGEDEKKRYKHWLNAGNLGKAQAGLSMAASLPQASCVRDEFDQNGYLLNVQNGTLDLRDGRLYPHDRLDFITRLANVEYSPDAECPLWRKFVLEIMDGDQELAEYLQRVAGYSATADMSEQIFFFAIGPGCNGKSVFLQTLMAVLGDYATPADASAFVEQSNPGGPRPEIVKLVDARFVAAAEMSRSKSLDVSLLKSWTGGDRQTARGLYVPPIDFHPVGKIFMSANEKPPLKDSSSGAWRRLHLIPFKVNFEDRKDLDLPGKLLTERAGILNWILQGTKNWSLLGLLPPKKVLAASRAYRDEMDPIGRFLSEECTIGGGNDVEASRLFFRYQSWCQECGEMEWSSTAFGKALSSKGFAKKRSRRGNSYVGVNLNCDLEAATEGRPVMHESMM